MEFGTVSYILEARILRGWGENMQLGTMYYIVEAKVKRPWWGSVLHCGGQS
jgi:hypothetical protein